jgi:short-subunit dehydrogenase
MPRRTLAGCRALVTGASSGIGRALALDLARAGVQLALTARRADRLQALCDEIAAGGGRAEFVAGDIADAEVRAACLARADSALGGLDLLVNNAGVGATGPFAAADPPRLRQIMEVNFFAAAELTRAALPLLRRGRRPAIVNVGSILAHRPIPGAAEYCASKAALRGWSESLRAELAAEGIDVLLASPASTDTEFFDHLLARGGEPAWRARRAASPEAVARRIVAALRAGRREVFPSLSARLVWWANRLAPGTVAWFVRRRP